MRILLFVLGIIVVATGIDTRAEAQNYPWCADYGGFCNANTQYVSPAMPVPRDRKHS